jgi:hypothetical protein
MVTALLSLQTDVKEKKKELETEALGYVKRRRLERGEGGAACLHCRVSLSSARARCAVHTAQHCALRITIPSNQWLLPVLVTACICLYPKH